MSSKIVNTKGWNWGYYDLQQEQMAFQVNGQPCFMLNYKDIALSTATGKNEVTFEFQVDSDNKNDKSDILTEMRFYVPQSELDGFLAQQKEENKGQQVEEEKKQKKNKTGSQASGQSQEESEESEEEEEESQVTPAQVFNEKVIKAAGIGEFAGEMIASLQELPMLIPRGKYSLQLYSTFAKLHGRTNGYKIQYKDITKGFLLPKPDGIHMAYVLHLKVPLRQGQTLHHHIALQFERQKTVKVPINLSPDQIKEQFGDRLQPEIEGPLYDVISKLFRELIKINILIPSEFKSSKKDDAIKCSVKASDGYLYPLKTSIIFIHKPVIYLKHTEIKYVEFSRVGQISSGIPSRTFDITIASSKDGQSFNFAGIDKAEHKNLVNYLKNKNIKMRSVDVETQQQVDFDVDDEDLDEEEEDDDQGAKGGRGGRPARKAAQKAQMVEEDYDSEEDDESFNDNESPRESDDEEGEEEDSEDVSMDEDLADDIKALKGNKDVKEVTGKRSTRGIAAPAKGSAKGSAINSQRDEPKSDKKKGKK